MISTKSITEKQSLVTTGLMRYIVIKYSQEENIKAKKLILSDWAFFLMYNYNWVNFSPKTHFQ